MAVRPVPEGYRTVTPYLVVDGAERLLAFLRLAFDANVRECMRRPDGRVAHAEARIGDSVVMMGDAAPGKPPMPSCLYLYVDDTDEVYRRAISAGATSIMEPANQFWGDRNAAVVDRSGNQWWIGTHVEDVPPEEMERRAKAHFEGR